MQIIRNRNKSAIDPFFGDETLLAMELCRKHRIPYVTIDSPHDSALHQHAAVNVVSKECTGEHYAGMRPEAVMERMTETPPRNHLALGDGAINLPERIRLAESRNARCVLETKTIQALKQSVQWLRGNMEA